MSSATATIRDKTIHREVAIGPLHLTGDLWLPLDSGALVIFAHGSGSSRLSPRNRAVAVALNEQGIGTLLFDLLTPDEELNRANVFDIPLLADRLIEVVRWVDTQSTIAGKSLGLFGASTGAAAALVAAARIGERIGAVVSRGGRPDLADAELGQVIAPTLLIVGGRDTGVIELNELAYARLRCVKSIDIVPGATHLFPEPGAMNTVIALAARWFRQHLVAAPKGR